MSNDDLWLLIMEVLDENDSEYAIGTGYTAACDREYLAAQLAGRIAKEMGQR